MNGQSGEGLNRLPASAKSRSVTKELHYPEGGWGYVVVLAAFAALMTQMGLIVSMGVYLEYIEQEFNSGAGFGGWISSGCFAVLAFMSPVAGHVMKRLGCRYTAMIGGAIMCFGFVGGTLAKSIVQLFIFADVVAGIGGSFSHISATVVIGQYFNKHYALANGFAYTGQGVGIFIFPPVLEALIQAYGWRGCMLVQGALCLHIAVAAALYRPVRRRRGHRLRSAGKDTGDVLGACRYRHIPNSENQSQDSDSRSGFSDENGHFPDGSATDSTAVSASELASSKSSVSAADSVITLQQSCYGHLQDCNGTCLEEQLAFLECASFSDESETDSTAVSESDFPSSEPSVSARSTNSLPRPESCHRVTKHTRTVRSDDCFLRVVSRTELSRNNAVGSTTTTTSANSDVAPLNSASTGQLTVANTTCGDLYADRTTQVHKEKSKLYKDSKPMMRTKSRREFSKTYQFIRNNPPVYFIFAIFFFETFGYGGFFSHVVAKAREAGIDENRATYALSIFGYSRDMADMVMPVVAMESGPALIPWAICQWLGNGLWVSILPCAVQIPGETLGSPWRTFSSAINGIGSLVGRASNGLMVDRGLLTAKCLNAVALILAGAASVLVSLADLHPGVITGAFFSGLGSGWYMPLQQVLLRDIVGQSKLHQAYGYGLIFEGAGSLGGGFVAGLIRDISGTYEASFYFLGFVFLVGAAILALDYCCERRGLCRGKYGEDENAYMLDVKKRLAIKECDNPTPV